jgi:hypothetical protein
MQIQCYITIAAPTCQHDHVLLSRSRPAAQQPAAAADADAADGTYGENTQSNNSTHYNTHL